MTDFSDLSPSALTASVGHHLSLADPKAFRRLVDTVERARRGVLPLSGPTARGVMDEWSFDPPGEPRPGGAAERSMPKLGRGGPTGRMGRSATRPGTGAGGAPRSPMLAKGNLARGSQAAVVKLASFGSGPARAAALLNYQSNKGELTLERQDGTTIVGAREVADVAASWEGSKRAPSNDVLSFRMTVEGSLSREEAQAGLQEALRGHSYAWAYSREGEVSRIGVALVAASLERDDRGRLERIYANDRSILGLNDRLEARFGGWPNDIGEPRWEHGVDGAATALARLTRGGEVDAYTPDGRTLREAAGQMWEARPSAFGRPVPDTLNPSLEIARSWQSEMRSRSPRDFARVILSAKPGTDKQAFMDAARARPSRPIML